MMRITSRVLARFTLSFAALCVVSAARSQPQDVPFLQAQSGDAGEAVSVDRMVELALSRNPELLAARQRLAEAEGLLRQAGLRPNPAIDVSVANGDALNSSGEREVSVGYSHTFELGGKRERRVNVAQRAVELARSQVANRERLLASEVRTRYGEALAALRNLQNAEELLQLTRQSFDLAKARAETGEGAPLEQGLLQVEVNRIDSDRLMFASQVERSVLEAKLLAGLPLDQDLRLSGLLDKPVELPALENVVEMALSRRPDLTTARLHEELAEAELQLARSSATPDVVARGGYSHIQSRFDQLGFSEPGGNLVPLRDKDNLLTGGISILLPLANRNQGNIEAAIARQRAARLERESLERMVRQEVLAALSRLTAASRALELFSTGVIGQSQENLRVVRGAYDLGELRLLDVINEQRRLIETQRAYTELLRDAFVAGVELERAMGTAVK
ncbi:MAG: TolC family protein [Acidobacteria bacterium]|nr:MAG: TolC family protein [Acidobacteriota bacterium]